MTSTQTATAQTQTSLSTRDYRVIYSTRDEQQYISRHRNALDSGRTLPWRIVRADLVEQIDEYISHDLSVSEWRRQAPQAGARLIMRHQNCCRAEVPRRLADYLQACLAAQAAADEDGETD